MMLVLWNTERIATELAFCGLAPSGARAIPQNLCLQGPGTHDRLRVRNDPADELLGGVAHLGHGDRDLTLSSLDRLWTRPVARARGRHGPFVPGSTQEGRHFLFDGALQHQPSTQTAQFGQVLTVLTQPTAQQLVNLRLKSSARGYSFHLA